MESKKMYVLSMEWRTEGWTTKYEILSVFDNKESAVAALKEQKDMVMTEYTSESDDFQIETDNDFLFEYQENEWDKYYIVLLTEKELNKTYNYY